MYVVCVELEEMHGIPRLWTSTTGFSDCAVVPTLMFGCKARPSLKLEDGLEVQTKT